MNRPNRTPRRPARKPQPGANARCQAIGCERQVHPRMLMCGAHWRKVPVDLQSAVWRHFRRGQIADPTMVSNAYMVARFEAIIAVAEGERHPVPDEMRARLVRYQTALEAEERKP